MNNWASCKNLLCIRLDNMGDLLMSEPAIRAVKSTFGCKITLLSSSMAAPIARYIKAIDETLIFDSAWVKRNDTPDKNTFFEAIQEIRNKNFDGAIVFSVFSQNPMPAIMLTYLAGIPKRIAYCRENPYDLLTDWLPDKEPYTTILHQVRRDLNLVQAIGASIHDDSLQIALPASNTRQGNELKESYIVLHPSVSEEKRKFPSASWIDVGKRLLDELPYRILITGGKGDAALCEHVANEIGRGASSTAGKLDLSQFIHIIEKCSLLVSVNTSAIHIAAATKTKMIVLYALTNPQHTPWRAIGKVFPFSVPPHLQSKNEVLRFIHDKHFHNTVPIPSADAIVEAAKDLLLNNSAPHIPELMLPGKMAMETMAI